MDNNTTATTNNTNVNTNTALMSHRDFDSFVKSTVASFLSTYNLDKIVVDVGNGYKGSIKVNKNGELETMVTFKEII